MVKRIYVYSIVFLIFTILCIIIFHDGESERIARKAHISYLGEFIAFEYEKLKRLPTIQEYNKDLIASLINKEFYKSNKIFYKYSPQGFKSPDGRIYRIIILDKKEEILYKVVIEEDKVKLYKKGSNPDDGIDFYVDSEPYFPEWTKIPLK